MTSTFFQLSAVSAAKADSKVIGADEAAFAAVRRRVDDQIADTRIGLDAARKTTDLRGAGGVERDLEVRRLERRLRRLSRVGTDLILGRITAADGRSTYIGRIGVSDADGSPLLVDWRTPDAEPFFTATLADPHSLVSRRHYRWSRGVVIDYWDEWFAVGDDAPAGALDAQSSFLAGLAASRSSTMTSVLGTIAADQDAAIRASSRGPLVVDGGPGTGKTVVALHRAAYLAYADPRLQGGRGRLLFVGPHRPYLAYIADILPSLGEEGVVTCTPTDLVPQGDAAAIETDCRVAALKSTVEMMFAVEPAVRFYEEPPRQGSWVETEAGDVWVSVTDWTEAVGAAETGVPHNEARADVWEALVDVLADGDDEMRAALSRSTDLVATLGAIWPTIEPDDLVSDLWTVPAYLRRCAPHLTDEEVTVLQRTDAKTWTDADLPILDAASRRLGDSAAARRDARNRAEAAERRRTMDAVVGDLISSSDDGESLVSMLRAEDIQGVIVDDAGAERPEPDALAGPFAHIVVDEAQELTDAQWRMLVDRCPSGSFTVVGDRAQARDGFTESWVQRLRRVGAGEARLRTLTVNYRTPEEIMAVAGPAVLQAISDANVPTSVRTGGTPVVYGRAADLDGTVARWLRDNTDGTVCVIGAPEFEQSEVSGDGRVTVSTPQTAKGLEFDLVVLVDPGQFGDGVAGAVDRYVAMTRSTRELIVLTTE
ncbi:AAA family ATPase [Gordonia sp. HY002]|uniref:RNA polymerase recycling motor ATPase HelR n=1 Tax=Gordonia zhenghanii TaxID=2911516 RepID=UPI001EF111CC|nr:RNA polymerase recycling motor ATPase HelR [Gordonia zhenghanii]MCF8571777.1 AAA family ATPase [Gordonia zhenghanii]MCF8604789.1 AAA family ATPase [Gordonia zhenghanii]